jgi:hypothetical protein
VGPDAASSQQQAFGDSEASPTHTQPGEAVGPAAQDGDATATTSATNGSADPAVLAKGHKGYYFFDSKGNRLPNKW